MSAGAPLEDLELKIKTAVLNQLETNKLMEVDSDPALPERIDQLEAKLEQLTERQDELQTTVQQNAVENALQVQTLQGSIQAQQQHMEQALNRNAITFQEQFQQEAKRQEGVLANMFSTQMAQFQGGLMAA